MDAKVTLAQQGEAIITLGRSQSTTNPFKKVIFKSRSVRNMAIGSIVSILIVTVITTVLVLKRSNAQTTGSISMTSVIPIQNSEMISSQTTGEYFNILIDTLLCFFSHTGVSSSNTYPTTPITSSNTYPTTPTTSSNTYPTTPITSSNTHPVTTFNSMSTRSSNIVSTTANNAVATSVSYARSYIGFCSASTSSSLVSSSLTPIGAISLTSASDIFIGICNAAVGRDATTVGIGNGICQSPTGQTVSTVVDGNLTTKYLNFGFGDHNSYSSLKGVGTGFVIIPQSGNFSVLQAFRFGTADDTPTRDPITITIEGSQSNNSTYLLLGSAWSLIYYGWTGINLNNDPGRTVYGDLQTISQASAYRAYRILIASQRGSDDCVQYSEVRLLGYFIN
ncbi:unnamed protein product [Adineta steineri]|uniref:Uncharacterized protein n=1 Tax=Adineta steineri TaxID=433720 RepID=A0A819NC03_9BILA|nr:unnamed protein product [Adineta steineri]CAF3993311.1 unnamed protein product [Adineta steineri]